jgi:hypothetical protein
VKFLLKLARAAGVGLSAFLESLFAPPMVIAALLLCGVVAAVYGAFLLLGAAWALIVAAPLLFLLAGIMARGMNG